MAGGELLGHQSESQFKYLLFGGTGFLGRTFLAQGLAGQSISRSIFDFGKPQAHDLKPYLAMKPKAAFITAAISNPDTCKVRSDLSEQVNVVGTIELLKILRDEHITPIFYSSDHVFDGKKGFYEETDPVCPITLYGEQKVLVETFLRNEFDEYLIFRTSKQIATRVDPRNSVSDIGLRLLAGETVPLASDQRMAPTFVEDICFISKSAVERGLSGLFHLAPLKDYSRYELGVMVAEALKLPKEKVKPCSMADFKFVEVRPPLCTLNGNKLKTLLNYRLTPLKVGLEELAKNLLKPSVNAQTKTTI